MSEALLDPAASGLLPDAESLNGPPGVVLAIADGEHLSLAAAGVEDVDSGVFVTTAHTQDIASVSKVLTTLAVLELIRRGGLTLDASLGRVLGMRSGRYSDATVEDLLRHRAGLRQWWPLYLESTAADDPIGTALALSPCAPRDVERCYSDLGMMVLGEVIERISGTPFVAAVTELVLAPVGAVTVTPGHPAEHLPALSGPEGDAIEREMVRSGEPYPVGLNGAQFAWRTTRVIRDTADGNAFHAFGGTAGHAGWFSDVSGLLRLASALTKTGMTGVDSATRRAMWTTRDSGQGLGVRRYSIMWRGKRRDLLGHPGFTGAFVGASPAVAGEPELRMALLANRLHGAPPPSRHRLVAVDALWRRALSAADSILNPITSGN